VVADVAQQQTSFRGFKGQTQIARNSQGPHVSSAVQSFGVEGGVAPVLFHQAQVRVNGGLVLG